MTPRALPGLLAVLAVLAGGAAACGVGADEATKRALPPLTEPTTTTAPVAPTTTAPDCDPTASYAPLSPVPSSGDAAAADPFMKKIVERGQLVVAVDENTKYLAGRNPKTGELEGTEIEIAKRIAQRIFDGEPGDHVRFKTVSTKQKIDFPEHDLVDLSISAISMTCDRWQRVAFSSLYMSAVHQYLVRDDSPIQSKDDIAGKRVCVTKGSTSTTILDEANAMFRQTGRKPAVIVPVELRTDCLLQVQEGDVDAYLGHDTFLTGMLEQNPALRVVDEGRKQYYGIAVGHDHTYFVRYVNGVLAEMRDDGELQSLVPAGRTVPPVGNTRPLP